MDVVYEFVIWFAVSLVGSFFIVTSLGNPFIKAFIFALAISFLATKNKD